jgi:hypothetical protein
MNFTLLHHLECATYLIITRVNRLTHRVLSIHRNQTRVFTAISPTSTILCRDGDLSLTLYAEHQLQTREPRTRLHRFYPRRRHCNSRADNDPGIGAVEHGRRRPNRGLPATNAYASSAGLLLRPRAWRSSAAAGPRATPAPVRSLLLTLLVRQAYLSLM